MTTRCGRDPERAALAAAGLLAPREDAEFHGHAAGCPACAALVAQFEALAESLRGLSPALAPPGLTSRAQASARAELARRAERRGERLILGAAVALSWVAVGVSTLTIGRLADWAPGVAAILPGGPPLWIAVFSVVTWTAAATAALTLHRAADDRRS